MSKYNDIYWRTIRLEFVKRVNELSSGLQKVIKWILWRDRPPSLTQKGENLDECLGRVIERKEENFG
jgi:hypothetical protein